MKFFVIISHQQDHLFEKKKRIIENVSCRYDIESNFAPKKQNLDHFDLEKSMELLKGADFIIADLSYARPSCYYEVGFVQALGKPIGLLAQSETEIFQLIDRESVRFYKDYDEYESFIEDILLKYAENKIVVGI